MSLFKIVLCELFHPLIFGIDENSDKNINGHFIVLNTYNNNNNNNEEYTDSDDEDTDEEYPEYEYPDYEELEKNNNIFEIVEKDIKELRRGRRRIYNDHPLIRNYKQIVKKSLKFEIAYCITLSGGEYIAILKTFWIKIIIRKYKKEFRKKMWNMYINRLNSKIEVKNKLLLKGLLL